MIYLILILLVGVNVSSFLMPNIYMWTAQQIYCQGVILLIFAWSFFEKPKENVVKNLPLALLFGWAVLSTTLISFKTLTNNNNYNMVNFITFYNFLLILILYKTVQSLSIKQINIVIKWLKYTVIATLFMTTLQIVGLSQFFKLLDPEGVPFFHHFHNNLAVGFIGNGTHLSGFLASCIPLFLYFGKREDWLSIILMGLVLCFTGTTIGDPSISGFVVAVVIFAFWWFSNKKIFYPYMAFLAICGFIGWRYLPAGFLSDHGRLVYLKHYWVIFKRMPVTGHGLGAINIFAGFANDHHILKNVLGNLRHLHMEFFQFTFELGLVGGCLIVYLVKDFFEVKVYGKEAKLFKAMILGFLISSCFNYPAHLWIPATWAMFAYASIYNLKNKEQL